VKNITVSLDDEIYRRARIKAAEGNTSVSALVKRFLIQLSSEESEFERRKRLQTETIAGIQSSRSFRGGDQLSREELHNRRALS
jgi:hypothetical protein